MQINKHIERTIEQKVFLFEMNFDISKYKDKFIEDIEKGIQDNSNYNYKTNVKGKMTNWQYFTKNNEFINIVQLGANQIKECLFLKDSVLVSAWGIKIDKGDKTIYHSHNEATYSGILYLNDCDNLLDFPELRIKIKPREGTFLFFSSSLQHGTEINKSDISKYAIPFNLAEKKDW